MDLIDLAKAKELKQLKEEVKVLEHYIGEEALRNKTSSYVYANFIQDVKNKIVILKRKYYTIEEIDNELLILNNLVLNLEKDHYDIVYEDAKKLFEEKRYNEAKIEFHKIIDYKDSKEFIEKCNKVHKENELEVTLSEILKAITVLKDKIKDGKELSGKEYGEIINDLDIFKNDISESEKSKLDVLNCELTDLENNYLEPIYFAAFEKYADEDYINAMNEFKKINDYKDSQVYLEICKQECEDYRIHKLYAECNVDAIIKDYKDSKEPQIIAIYNKALKIKEVFVLYEKKSYEESLNKLESISNYNSLNKLVTLRKDILDKIKHIQNEEQQKTKQVIVETQDIKKDEEVVSEISKDKVSKSFGFIEFLEHHFVLSIVFIFSLFLIITLPIVINFVNSANSSYEINYVLDGGTDKGLVKNFVSKKGVVLNDSVNKPYYEFKGFFLDSSFTIPVETNTRIFEHKMEDLTLYVKWEPCIYEISYSFVDFVSRERLTNVTHINPSVVTGKDDGKTLSAPSIDGYEFLEWAYGNRIELNPEHSHLLSFTAYYVKRPTKTLLHGKNEYLKANYSTGIVESYIFVPTKTTGYEFYINQTLMDDSLYSMGELIIYDTNYKLIKPVEDYTYELEKGKKYYVYLMSNYDLAKEKNFSFLVLDKNIQRNILKLFLDDSSKAISTNQYYLVSSLGFEEYDYLKISCEEINDIKINCVQSGSTAPGVNLEYSIIIYDSNLNVILEDVNTCTVDAKEYLISSIDVSNYECVYMYVSFKAKNEYYTYVYVSLEK